MSILWLGKLPRLCPVLTLGRLAAYVDRERLSHNSYSFRARPTITDMCLSLPESLPIEALLSFPISVETLVPRSLSALSHCLLYPDLSEFLTFLLLPTENLDVMTNSLSIEEILAHPAFPTVLKFDTPNRQGSAPVAEGRAGGPISIAYEIHGMGPIYIVWVMGLNGPKIAWYRQIKYFGHEHGNKFTSLFLDNRGVGSSDKPLTRYSTSEMAKDILDLLAYLGWTKSRQLHVIGVSMGGMISQELAYLAPQRIASLTLQSTAASLTTTLPWYQHIARRIEMIRPKPLAARLEAAKANLFSEEWLARPDDLGEFPTNGDRFVAEDLWRIENLPAPVYQGSLLQGLATTWHHMGTERLKVLGKEIPDILVLAGDQDAVIEHTHSDVLVDRIGGNARKILFPGAGHCLQFEVVNEYHSVLEDFFVLAHKKYRKPD